MSRAPLQSREVCSGSSMLQKLCLASRAGASDQLDSKDPARRRAVVHNPVRMDAGVAANQRAVVHGEPMRVTGIWREIHCLEHAPRCGVILDERRPVVGMIFAIVTDDLPDAAVVPRDRVITWLVRRLVERDHEFWLPRVRVDTENCAQPKRGDPELTIVPESAVAPASVVRRAKRNLAMADLFGVHVHLKYTFRRCIGAHPNISAAHSHATGVSGLGCYGLQNFPFPIHEPGVFGEFLRLG